MATFMTMDFDRTFLVNRAPNISNLEKKNRPNDLNFTIFIQLICIYKMNNFIFIFELDKFVFWEQSSTHNVMSLMPK